MHYFWITVWDQNHSTKRQRYIASLETAVVVAVEKVFCRLNNEDTELKLKRAVENCFKLSNKSFHQPTTSLVVE